MHEAVSRIPLIIRYPKRFAAGKTCSIPVSLIDMAPTILAVTGIEIKTHALDGVDLADVAAGVCDRGIVFSQCYESSLGCYMAVGESWKYFYSAPDDREFFFDHRSDPFDTRNQAGASYCAGALSYMKRSLMEHLRPGGETQALDGNEWRKYPPLDVPDDPNAKPRPLSQEMV